MALIKCPECGRENVSDSAEMCPACGYGIKAHFERLKVEEERKKREEEKSSIQEERKQDEIKYIESSSNNSNAIIEHLKEQEHNAKVHMLAISIWSIIWTILLIFSFNESDHGDMGLFIVLSLFCAGFGWILFFCECSALSTAQNDIVVARKSMDEYNKRVEQRKQMAMEIAKKEAQKQAYKHPKCPNCGSTNTQRISTANRATSVAMVGLASSKIGKQYECKNCKHKW